MLFCFFVYWHSYQDSWLENQESGFRNRAIKHSLRTRQFILGYRGSTKLNLKKKWALLHVPCTFRQPWVSVIPLLFPKYSESLKTLHIRLWEEGAKICLNGTSKLNRRTDGRTHGQTFWLIERIGPEGFEKWIAKAIKTNHAAYLVFKTKFTAKEPMRNSLNTIRKQFWNHGD